MLPLVVSAVTLFSIIIAVLAVSVISLVGLVFLGLKQRQLKEITHLLVSFSVGALLGGAFLHLLPESIDPENLYTLLFVIVGILLFFVMEKYFHWRHCHDGVCTVHAVAYLNLLGDGVHNFMDGVAIAAAFIVSIPTGIAATVAIAIHEIPQEIGDYGVLIHSGMSRRKALLYNFISALGALAGAIIAYYFAGWARDAVLLIMPTAAGGFIYMACTDLMPELHKERQARNSILEFTMIVLGVALMWIMKVYFDAG